MSNSRVGMNPWETDMNPGRGGGVGTMRAMLARGGAAGMLLPPGGSHSSLLGNPGGGGAPGLLGGRPDEVSLLGGITSQSKVALSVINNVFGVSFVILPPNSRWHFQSSTTS